jgi:hypothetical protein
MGRPPSTESLGDFPVGSIIEVAEVLDCVKNSKSKWAA